MCFLRPGVYQSSALFPYTTLFRSEADVAPHIRLHRGPREGPEDRAHRQRHRGPGRLTVGTIFRPFPWTAMQPYVDRKSTRLNSSHVEISYAVFCLKKKT